MYITKDTFEKEVLQNEKPVLVYFYRKEGCSNCEKMKPLIETFEEKNPSVKVCRYECGKTQDEVTSKYKFKTFPGIFTFINGKPIRGFSGMRSLDQLSLSFADFNTLKIALADTHLRFKIDSDLLLEEISNYNQNTQVDNIDEEKCIKECESKCEVKDEECKVKCQFLCEHERPMNEEEIAELKAKLTK